MSDPSRWSEASSDVDPVLRAVMRYAQGIEPSAQDVADWAATVARAEERRDSHRAGFASRALALGRSRRRLAWIGAFAFVGVAGVALGMTIALEPHRVPKPVVTPEFARQAREPLQRAASVAVEDVAPSPAVSASAPTRVRQVVASPAPSAADPTSELQLLAAARRNLVAHPAQSLSLLAKHGNRYPTSTFGEERAALRIEALFALGRTTEAERDFGSFVDAYPSSIYTPRLKSKRAPSGTSP